MTNAVRQDESGPLERRLPEIVVLNGGTIVKLQIEIVKAAAKDQTIAGPWGA